MLKELLGVVLAIVLGRLDHQPKSTCLCLWPKSTRLKLRSDPSCLNH